MCSRTKKCQTALFRLRSYKWWIFFYLWQFNFNQINSFQPTFQFRTNNHQLLPASLVFLQKQTVKGYFILIIVGLSSLGFIFTRDSFLVIGTRKAKHPLWFSDTKHKKVQESTYCSFASTDKTCFESVWTSIESHRTIYWDQTDKFKCNFSAEKKHV